jgi:hypothetical protein
MSPVPLPVQGGRMSMSHLPPPPPLHGPPPGYGPPPGRPVAPPAAASRWSKTVVVGLIAAALGFVEISFSSSRTVNGVVVECSYFNLAPWLFGPVALVCGLLALTRAGGRGPVAGRDRALGAGCMVVGALHLLQAFGVIELLSGSPC